MLGLNWGRTGAELGLMRGPTTALLVSPTHRDPNPPPPLMGGGFIVGGDRDVGTWLGHPGGVWGGRWSPARPNLPFFPPKRLLCPPPPSPGAGGASTDPPQSNEMGGGSLGGSPALPWPCKATPRVGDTLTPWEQVAWEGRGGGGGIWGVLEATPQKKGP